MVFVTHHNIDDPRLPYLCLPAMTNIVTLNDTTRQFTDLLSSPDELIRLLIW